MCSAEKTTVTLIFDIGKTNKKCLLFDSDLKLIYDEENRFKETTDDDGFPCDDFDQIEKWIKEKINKFVNSDKYCVEAINFTTYGATLVYLNKDGKRITPVYNYLKPLTSSVDSELYKEYGGKEEFCRKTASPALGMLNSGLQILELKKTKPSIYKDVETILHLPQYLSFLASGEVTSELTSIGCHTAMWDFDNMQYHQWLNDKGIKLPEPSDLNTTFKQQLNGNDISIGIGIHDSSASLVPYLLGTNENFILVSTGTWCINMNPFNYSPLTKEELEQDCLNFLSIKNKPVKSSRIILGHIHDLNTKRLTDHFIVNKDAFKFVALDKQMLKEMLDTDKKVFFKCGVPDDLVDNNINLSRFSSFEEAYHRLMVDLALVVSERIDLIIDNNKPAENIFITGGFARNTQFITSLATIFDTVKVYISEIDNSTSLGAAMVVNKTDESTIDLGLTRINAIK